MCWTRLVVGEGCCRFAGLMEMRAIYERPHAFCLWSADGQTNGSGVSPQGFRIRQAGVGGFDLLKQFEYEMWILNIPLEHLYGRYTDTVLQ